MDRPKIIQEVIDYTDKITGAELKEIEHIIWLISESELQDIRDYFNDLEGKRDPVVDRIRSGGIEIRLAVDADRFIRLKKEQKGI